MSETTKRPARAGKKSLAKLPRRNKPADLPGQKFIVPQAFDPAVMTLLKGGRIVFTPAALNCVLAAVGYLAQEEVSVLSMPTSVGSPAYVAGKIAGARAALGMLQKFGRRFKQGFDAKQLALTLAVLPEMFGPAESPTTPAGGGGES